MDEKPYNLRKTEKKDYSSPKSTDRARKDVFCRDRIKERLEAQGEINRLIEKRREEKQKDEKAPSPDENLDVEKIPSPETNLVIEIDYEAAGDLIIEESGQKQHTITNHDQRNMLNAKLDHTYPHTYPPSSNEEVLDYAMAASSSGHEVIPGCYWYGNNENIVQEPEQFSEIEYLEDSEYSDSENIVGESNQFTEIEYLGNSRYSDNEGIAAISEQSYDQNKSIEFIGNFDDSSCSGATHKESGQCNIVSSSSSDDSAEAEGLNVGTKNTECPYVQDNLEKSKLLLNLDNDLLQIEEEHKIKRRNIRKETETKLEQIRKDTETKLGQIEEEFDAEIEKIRKKKRKIKHELDLLNIETKKKK